MYQGVGRGSDPFSKGMNFEEQVLSAIREYGMIPDGARVLVGISGGADSVCLLAVLEKLRRTGQLGDGVQLRAVHVHHGLRSTADRDERFVRELCGRLGVSLSVHHVDAAAEAARRGMSLEEAGRSLRREVFLRECAASPCRVALAHHLEDSAETLLFNLCRGSSTAGLAGIRPVSVLETSPGESPCSLEVRPASPAEEHIPAGTETAAQQPLQGARQQGILPSSVLLIRPLIRVSRSEIEDWLSRQGMTWCTDETNADTRFTRNYLRRKILPDLEEHVNAKAAQHMARAALDLSAAEEYLQEETGRRLSECRIPAGQADPAGRTNSAGQADHAGEPYCAESLHSSGQAAAARDFRPSYSVQKLRELPPYWRRRALYRAMTELVPAKDLGDAHVEALLRLLESTGSAHLDLPYGLAAEKEYEVLTLVPAGPPREAPSQLPGRTNETPRPLLSHGGGPGCTAQPEAADASARLPLSADCYRTRIFPYARGMEIPAGPCTKWVDYDKITQSLSFRTRRSGDVIALGLSEDGVPRYKKLSRVMIDRKIPKRLRESIVLPMDGQNVIWLPGCRIGADYRITRATRTVLELQLTASEDGQM